MGFQQATNWHPNSMARMLSKDLPSEQKFKQSKVLLLLKGR